MAIAFKYKATDKDGNPVEAGRLATDRFALARELRAEGLSIISAQPINQPSRFSTLSLFGGKPSTKDKIVFAQSLSAMVGAGLSLSRALMVLERQTKKVGFKKIIQDLGERISRGESFSVALAAFPNIFPPVFTAMVMSGEESGNLAQALESIHNQLDKSYNLMRKIKGAMIYPAIIVLAVISIGVLMMIFLVPNLTAIFLELNTELPLSTRIVIGVSDFLSHYTFIFLLGVIGLGIGGGFFLRSVVGRRALAWTALHLPIIKKISRELNSAVTMRTISSLITAGVGMVESIHITRKVVQNPFFQEILDAAAAEIQKGQSLSGILRAREDLYPVLVGEMTEVGEETGKLAEMLAKGALFYEGEVDQATKNLSTIIEPALMIFIGLAVGFFAISMIGPIYSLSDSL